MKNVAVLTEDGAFALFFVPTPGDLTAQESPPPGICHPRQKKMLMPGGQPGRGLGAGGIDLCITQRPRRAENNTVFNLRWLFDTYGHVRGKSDPEHNVTYGPQY